MSDYTEVKVNIDGMGKIIPCIAHSDDHVSDKRSSATKSTMSSIYKRDEFRCEIVRHNFLSKFDIKMKGAPEIESDPG